MVAVRTRVRSIIIGIMLTLITPFNSNANVLSTLASNDPFPVFTSLDPHEFLFTREKMLMIGYPLELPYPQQWSFSISPFGQNACLGKNFCGERIPLGDLGGRWGMVGLMFDPLPEGRVLPPQLEIARDNIFPDIPPGELTDERWIDPAQLFGFFSIPLDYKKRGLRFEFSAMLGCIPNVGFIIQAGASDIVQKVCGFDNLTCLDCSTQEARQCSPSSTSPSSPVVCAPSCCGRIFPTLTGASPEQILCCGRSTLFPTSNPADGPDDNPAFSVNNINRYLMYELATIADQIGLDICNFHETSIEDLRGILFWRDGYYLNKGRLGWAEFLFIPFIEIGASVATGKKKNPNTAFGLPFGNNGHHSIGAAAGINFDFIRTVEIGAEVGMTHFFPRDFCNYRIPNGVPSRRCQLGIYPFTTDVRIWPGYNWHFGAKMLSYRFIDRLSFFFQYLLVHHERDQIALKKPDPAFRPEYLEESSWWQVQLANIGFYYDISPSMSLGVLWQAPLSQRHAYRSTTVLFSFNATY